MSDLPTLLPPNAPAEMRAIEVAIAEGKRDLAQPIATLWNASSCPENLLPWLAWALSVDDWNSDWPVGVKRQVISSSISVHRKKGTVAAVKEAIRAAGYNDAQVIERFGWDFHDGSAFHDGSVTFSRPDHWAEFRVALKRPITIEQAEELRRIIRQVAPARSRLKVLDFTEAANLYNNRRTYDGAYTHGAA